MVETDIKAGMRVRVIQGSEPPPGMPEADPCDYTTSVDGMIVSVEPQPIPTTTGYAHGKDGKFWLLRITLQKDDGEISVLALDRHTQIVPLDS